MTTQERLELPYKVRVTKEARRQLRGLKKLRNQSMAAIVCQLIEQEFKKQT